MGIAAVSHGAGRRSDLGATDAAAPTKHAQDGDGLGERCESCWGRAAVRMMQPLRRALVCTWSPKVWRSGSILRANRQHGTKEMTDPVSSSCIISLVVRGGRPPFTEDGTALTVTLRPLCSRSCLSTCHLRPPSPPLPVSPLLPLAPLLSPPASALSPFPHLRLRKRAEGESQRRCLLGALTMCS